MIHSWLNLQLQNPQIQRADLVQCLTITLGKNNITKERVRLVYKFECHYCSSFSDKQSLFTFHNIFGDFSKFQLKSSLFSLILPTPAFYIQLNKTIFQTTFKLLGDIKCFWISKETLSATKFSNLPLLIPPPIFFLAYWEQGIHIIISSRIANVQPNWNLTKPENFFSLSLLLTK